MIERMKRWARDNDDQGYNAVDAAYEYYGALSDADLIYAIAEEIERYYQLKPGYIEKDGKVLRVDRAIR